MTDKYYVYTIVENPEEAGEEIVSEGSIDGSTFMVVKLKIYVNTSLPVNDNSNKENEL